MAITRSTKAGSSSTTNGTSYTFATTAPNPDRLLVALLAYSRGGGNTPQVPSISGWSGVTWELVDSLNYSLTGTQSHGIAVFVAKSGASPGSGNLTVTFAATHSGLGWVFLELDGVDLSGPDAVDAVVQDASNSGTGTSSLISMSSFADPNNAVCVAWSSNGIENFSLEAGYVGFAVDYTTPDTEFNGAFKATEDSTPSASWSGSSVAWGGIAIEVKVAPAINLPAISNYFRMLRRGR